MFDAPLSFGEYVTREQPALADIFRVVFDHLRDRTDVVLFGSHAVNAYVDPPRMTADVDILSTDAEEIAEGLRSLLAKKFHIAVRVRGVARGRGWRVYQIQSHGSRHLIDVRQTDKLPPTRSFEDIRVIAPPDLVLSKLEGYVARKHTEKGLTDKVDLYRMLRAFPLFRSENSRVSVALRNAPPAVQAAWQELLENPIDSTDDDEY